MFLTAASLPTVEDAVMAAIPGLPQVVLHSRLVDDQVGAVHDGKAPMLFRFGATISCVTQTGLSFEPVPGNSEASCQMPGHLRRSAFDRFFRGGGWVRLQTETIDRLQAFRGRGALVTWNEVIDRLLEPLTGEVI